MKTESNVMPNVLDIRHLGNNSFEILYSKNIEEKEVFRDDKKETIYAYDLKIEKATIKSIDEAIAVLVHLEYSKDDELALVNKGILDKDNIEYVEYRNYVNWCKEQVDAYFYNKV